MTPGAIVRHGERFAAALFVVGERAVLVPVVRAEGGGNRRRGDVALDVLIPLRHPVARCGEAFVVSAALDPERVGMVPDLAALRGAAMRAAETAGIEAKFARAGQLQAA